MRTIEQILLDLNATNLTEQIKLINNQLEYYINHKMEANGISLIPVRDLLDKQYTDKDLRANGYILTATQLKEDADKFIELAEKNPILYNSILKRLHRSIQVFEQNYVSGNMKNETVIKEVKKHFLDTLQSSYSDKENSKMPEKLRQLIDKKIEDKIGQHNANWYKNTLSDDINVEFSELLTKKLLEDFKKNTLTPDVKNKLLLEKNAINSVDALITCFRKKELPSDIQGNIKNNLIDMIKIEMEAGHITSNDPLGSIINTYRNQSLRADREYDAISKVIINWQNKQTADDVSEGLEKYLRSVVNNMKQTLDSNLTQQFEELAVKVFIDKLQQSQYQENLNSIMSEYSLITLRQLNLNNLPKCREAIYIDVMNQLHEQWIKGELPETKDFIQKTVFAFLHEVDDKIQEKVWPNKMKRGIEELVNDNAKLHSKVEKLETLLEQQTKLLSKLFSKLQPSPYTANNNENNSTENLSIKMGMFGNT